MAAKKKTARKRSASTSSSESSAPATPARTVATSADVAPIDQPEAKLNTKRAERDPWPGIDPALSSDNAHSTYKDNNAAFPPDTGNQVLEIPGKPVETRKDKK